MPGKWQVCDCVRGTSQDIFISWHSHQVKTDNLHRQCVEVIPATETEGTQGTTKFQSRSQWASGDCIPASQWEWGKWAIYERNGGALLLLLCRLNHFPILLFQPESQGPSVCVSLPAEHYYCSADQVGTSLKSDDWHLHRRLPFARSVSLSTHNWQLSDRATATATVVEWGRRQYSKSERAKLNQIAAFIEIVFN